MVAALPVLAALQQALGRPRAVAAAEKPGPLQAPLAALLRAALAGALA
jgi:hypothetical protein